MTTCTHDWQENCPPETNHRPHCACGHLCVICGLVER
jgi:hypothetical protein